MDLWDPNSQTALNTAFVNKIYTVTNNS
jgi:hypothetical protein